MNCLFFVFFSDFVVFGLFLFFFVFVFPILFFSLLFSSFVYFKFLFSFFKLFSVGRIQKIFSNIQSNSYIKRILSIIPIKRTSRGSLFVY